MGVSRLDKMKVDVLLHLFQDNFLFLRLPARVAELVDALDLGSSTARCGGSSPPSRTQ